MRMLKYVLILVLIFITVVGLISFSNYKKPVRGFAKGEWKAIPACSNFSVDWLDTTYNATLLPGLGNLQYKISTPSRKAQEFFNQGLRLVYAFNHWEAIQAFRTVVREDPDCAMGYWGLALAYGPNLNDVNPGDREKFAQESIQKALARSGKATATEQALIRAMASRYDGKVHTVRDSLNRAYADGMIALSKQFSNDSEVLTLCADAIMNTMPWNYWESDGKPKDETVVARELLEKTLEKFPQHPGAHHLYIHLLEGSKTPGAALNSAKFLEGAMPGAGHLVHMPAHIYYRVGNYSRGIELNVEAVRVDENYLSTSSNQGMYRLGYYPHNIDFINYGSIMEGRSRTATETAMKMAYKGSLISTTNNILSQYFGAQPLLTFVRFGKWHDILSLPAPNSTDAYTHSIWRFARGVAFVRSNHIALAKTELTKLDSLAKLDTLKALYFSFNPVSDIVKVPAQLLRGEILRAEKKYDEAVNAFSEGAKSEDALLYMEPPDWRLPARHFLGAALLELEKYPDAEKVFLEDLIKNPENGWSLKGLLLAQQKLGKKSEAAATEKRFEASWKNADVKLSASRF